MTYNSFILTDIIQNIYNIIIYYVLNTMVDLKQVIFGQRFNIRYFCNNDFYNLTSFNKYHFISDDFFKISLLFYLILFISIGLYSLAQFLSITIWKDAEKLSQYECGFEPFDEATRQPFDVHFYIIGILFLIFDIEIALLFPWILSVHYLGIIGFFMVMLFIFLLIVGFFYEWHRGALVWPHKYLLNPTKKLSVQPDNESSLNPKTEKAILDYKNNKSFHNYILSMNLLFVFESYQNWTQFVEVFFYIGVESLLLISGMYLLYWIGPKKNMLKNSRVFFRTRVMSITTFNIMQDILKLIFGISLFSLLLFILFQYSAMPYLNMTCHIDLFVLLTKLSIIIVILSITSVSKHYLTVWPRVSLEYFVLIVFLTFFLFVLVAAYDLITLFFALIGFSVCLYVLLMIDVNDKEGRESSIKYFFLSIICTAILLFGIFCAYFLFNTTNYMSIAWSVSLLVPFTISNGSFVLDMDLLFGLIIMLVCLLIGFFFKLAVFPCHWWTPNIYEATSYTMIALLVLPIKITLFCTFIRLFVHVFGDLYYLWRVLVWLTAIWSLLFGCLGAVWTRRVKSFIAFTSINHMGILFLGLACGTFQGLQSSLFYLIIYVTTHLILFWIFIQTYEIRLGRPLLYKKDLTDWAYTNKTWSIIFALSFLSMAGIPPLAGFFGKYVLFYHCYETDNWVLVVIGMFTSIIATYYYIRIIKLNFFEIYWSIPITRNFETFITCLDKNTFIVAMVITGVLSCFIFITPDCLALSRLLTFNWMFPQLP